MERQRTIAKEVSCKGVGLHTGNASVVTFRPAAAGHGITFTRQDLPSSPVIPARHDQVQGTAIRGTTIGTAPECVHTIEHIMAACSALGIDNLEILITNNEPPILDGSALPFARILADAGMIEQDAEREYITLNEPVTYESGQTKITAYPSATFIVDCAIEYEHPFLSRQHARFTITKDIFLKEIAPARTFCFDYEIEALKNNGLARGGDLTNAIVVGLTGIHNAEPLRFPDEFVRHKLLDLIGDLYLTGKPIKARIVAERCGHNHNVNFIKALLAASRSQQKQTPADTSSRTEGNTMTPPTATQGTMYDINAIQKIIPHRYPFLMIDKVRIVEAAKSAIGYKCVSGNENFFQGHFPGQPIMPGVLIIEAMAQTSCVLMLSKPEMRNKLAFFMSIDGVKFRRTVIPGDVLELRVDVLRARERGGKVRGEAYVNGELTTEAEFMFAIVDKEAQT